MNLQYNVYLNPVKNKFFFERKSHAFFFILSMPEGNNQLNKNPPNKFIFKIFASLWLFTSLPSFESVRMVLNVNHSIDWLNYSITGYKLPLAHVDKDIA